MPYLDLERIRRHIMEGNIERYRFSDCQPEYHTCASGSWIAASFGTEMAMVVVGCPTTGERLVSVSVSDLDFWSGYLIGRRPFADRPLERQLLDALGYAVYMGRALGFEVQIPYEFAMLFPPALLEEIRKKVTLRYGPGDYMERVMRVMANTKDLY